MIYNIKTDALNEYGQMSVFKYIYYKFIKRKKTPPQVIGFDPTKPLPCPYPIFKEIEVFDIQVILNNKDYIHKYDIFLYPNEYTIATEKKEIFILSVNPQFNITKNQIIQRTVDVLNGQYKCIL